MWAGVRLGIAVGVICFCFSLSAQEQAKAVPFWTPRDGDVLVLLGDDVTESAGYSQLLENFFLTRYPQLSVRVVNSGVQGSLTSDAVERFTADVAVHHPTHVAVMLGMSDTGLKPYQEDRFQEYQRHIKELDRRIREVGAKPIYLSPAMFDAKAARNLHAEQDRESLPLINATLSYYGVWLREFAAGKQAKFIDIHSGMAGMTYWTRSRNPDFTMLPDGTHPNEIGNVAIASQILRELGLAQPLSSIEISCGSEMSTAVASGGTVQNLLVSPPNSLSFVWQAESLPWYVSLEEDLSRWRHMTEHFNREVLQIQGLAPGIYELLIDDRPVGQFSSHDLEKGIKLHKLSTPQLAQSQRIVDRNAERTETIVRPARDDWSVIQQQSRLRHERDQRSDELPHQESLAEIERLLDSLRTRQAQWLMAEEISFALLQEQAQPLPHHFVIRPLSTAEVKGRVLLGGVPIPGALVELHGQQGLTAVGTTDAMGFFRLKANMPNGISPGEGWLVVLAKMVLPKFISVEQSGHHVTIRSGLNEIDLHFESETIGQ